MLTDHMTSLMSLVVTVLVKNLLVFVLILVKVTGQANVNLLMTTNCYYEGEGEGVCDDGNVGQYYADDACPD